jgi:hypothetical protein
MGVTALRTIVLLDREDRFRQSLDKNTPQYLG